MSDKWEKLRWDLQAPDSAQDERIALLTSDVRSLLFDHAALLAERDALRSALEDLTEAGEEAWGSDRPCVKIARAALGEKP